MKVIDQAAWDACERIYPQKVMNLAEQLANLIEADLARGIPFGNDTVPSAIQLLVKSHGPICEPTRGAIILVLAKTWAAPKGVGWEDDMQRAKKYWKGKA